jgi:hypothetical protein
MKSIARRVAILSGIVTCLGLLPEVGGATIQGPLYLNEVVVDDPVERVELYNPGPGAIDLDSVLVRGTIDFLISGEGVLSPGEYRVIDLTGGGYLDNLGGETSLVDLGSGEHYDRVIYGQTGAAPLPHPGATVSLCRAPDGGMDPPFYNEAGYSDAGNWTLDLTATFGVANDAPVPSLGSTIRINEVKPLPGPDLVELYNPSALPANINIGGWFLTDGTTAVFLAGIVPGGGVLLLNVPMQIEATQLLYLFDADGVRVDQIGFLGARPLEDEMCLARCPDGAGPADGFDYLTSGGESTLYPLACTLGELNCPGTAIRRSSWGGVRILFR